MVAYFYFYDKVHSHPQQSYRCKKLIMVLIVIIISIIIAFFFLFCWTKRVWQFIKKNLTTNKYCFVFMNCFVFKYTRCCCFGLYVVLDWKRVPLLLGEVDGVALMNSFNKIKAAIVSTQALLSRDILFPFSELRAILCYIYK